MNRGGCCWPRAEALGVGSIKGIMFMSPGSGRELVAGRCWPELDHEGREERFWSQDGHFPALLCGVERERYVPALYFYYILLLQGFLLAIYPRVHLSISNVPPITTPKANARRVVFHASR